MDLNRICIRCMAGSTETGACPACGYIEGRYYAKVHHLQPYTILRGRYLVGRVLGEGGFGITYLAYDLASECRVAIKELFVSGVSQRNLRQTISISPSINARTFYRYCSIKFQDEARILSELENKEGIVEVREIFEENATSYIVMEYLDGMTLLDYLRDKGKRISFREAFTILRPMMLSLIQLHKLGVYHRDISPDNIQRLKDGSVKIMDFGGARQVLYSTSEDVDAHLLSLKQGYAPPEQYRPNYKIGPWMDVYSTAATFYRCICGQIPTPAHKRIREKEAVIPPRDMGVDISPELQEVILKGMALNIEDRYLDMREFYRALRKNGATMESEIQD